MQVRKVEAGDVGVAEGVEIRADVTEQSYQLGKKRKSRRVRIRSRKLLKEPALRSAGFSEKRRPRAARGLEIHDQADFLNSTAILHESCSAQSGRRLLPVGKHKHKIVSERRSG